MTIQFPPVTLLNGSQVPFEEFEKWSCHKQRMNLDHPIRFIKWDESHSVKMRSIVNDQYAKGIRRTKKHIGSANGQAISITTPDGIFPTKKAVCAHYGIDAVKLKKWMSEKPSEFYETTPLAEGRAKELRPGAISVQTPHGVFESINATARHFGVGPRTIKTWVRTLRKSEFKYLKNQTKELKNV